MSSITASSHTRSNLSLETPSSAFQIGSVEYRQPNLTKISVLTPAYNEASILEDHLTLLCQYLQQLEERYDWEIEIGRAHV